MNVRLGSKICYFSSSIRDLGLVRVEENFLEKASSESVCYAI